MLSVATVNVNGIRAAFRRGMGEWLDKRQPDVLLLQEVRGSDEILADHLDPAEWDLAHEAGAAKGRAGVAIASRLPMTAVRVGLGTGSTGDAGRWVEADVALPDGRTLTVVSVYLHSATVGTPSLDEKYAFCEHVGARLREPGGGRRAGRGGGDLNIAHREVDIKNWKGNLANAGFLPRERAYLDHWFDGLGWHDLGREPGRRRSRAVHVVVLAGQGVRQRRGVADRLPGSRPRPWFPSPSGRRWTARRRTPSGSATTPRWWWSSTPDGCPSGCPSGCASGPTGWRRTALGPAPSAADGREPERAPGQPRGRTASRLAMSASTRAAGASGSAATTGVPPSPASRSDTSSGT